MAGTDEAAGGAEAQREIIAAGKASLIEHGGVDVTTGYPL